MDESKEKIGEGFTRASATKGCNEQGVGNLPRENRGAYERCPTRETGLVFVLLRSIYLTYILKVQVGDKERENPWISSKKSDRIERLQFSQK